MSATWLSKIKFSPKPQHPTYLLLMIIISWTLLTFSLLINSLPLPLKSIVL